MPLNWTTTARASQVNGVKALVYGDSGTGKTRLCRTAPAPLIISAEHRTLSLRQYDFPVLLIHNDRDLDDAYKWLVGSAEARAIGTVCLDSLSEVAETLVAGLKLKEKDPRRAYMQVQDLMLSTVRAFRDLPEKHVLIIAKMAYEKDEGTGCFRYVPSMPGRQLGPQLPYLFDEVFRAALWQDPTTKQVHQYLQTQSDLQYYAKDCSGALAAMEAPDFSAIVNKIKGDPRP